MGKKNFHFLPLQFSLRATPICEISAAFTVSSFSRFHAATGTKAVVESETRWKTLFGPVYIYIIYLVIKIFVPLEIFKQLSRLKFRFQRTYYLHRNTTLFEQRAFPTKVHFAYSEINGRKKNPSSLEEEPNFFYEGQEEIYSFN